MKRLEHWDHSWFINSSIKYKILNKQKKFCVFLIYQTLRFSYPDQSKKLITILALMVPFSILASIVTILGDICGIYLGVLTQNLKNVLTCKCNTRSRKYWPRLCVLHLQVSTFFKHWVNTPKYTPNIPEYCHNTCKYWEGHHQSQNCDRFFRLIRIWKTLSMVN